MAVGEASKSRRSRSLLAFAATAALCGIAWSVSGQEDSGAFITVFALVLLIAALHLFGRTGPDASR